MSLLPPRPLRVLAALAALAAPLPLAAGCDDPEHARAVAALGPEAAGVAPGPLHRPGQPCTVCHGGLGPAETRFVLAGTVTATPDGATALAGARVRFLDWVGAQGESETNCAGNFYVREGAASITWPIWLKVERGTASAEMTSAVFREGSCNACHAATASAAHTGPVYLGETPLADAGCP